MIEIREVKTKKEQKLFLNFPLKLYKGNPYFVPPLYGDEKKIFRADYMYYDQADAKYFLAFREGKVVGRISGILQKAANEKWGQKRMRFTRFDSIDDQEVANALFGAVEKWAKELKMEEVVGPLGFSDLEREGLLIEGFDQLSTFEEQYSFPYYQALIENLGYEKDVDWIEHKLYPPAPEKMEKMRRVSEAALARAGLHVAQTKNTKEFLKKYAGQFFEITDATYAHLYGTVPLNEKTKKDLLSNFDLVLDQRFVQAVVDDNDRVACIGLCFPSLAKALQKSQGKLTLPAIFRVLRAVKKPKIIDLAIIGVLPKYRLLGISTALFYNMAKLLGEDKAEYAETNLTLETNHNILNQWKLFNSVEHKRRRSFVKKLNPSQD